jgi:competence protein ComEA
MFTPEERRGALTLLLVILLGALWDVSGWGRRPRSEPAPAGRTITALPDSGRGEPAPSDAARVAPAPAAAVDTLDLNRATAAELDRLPGIGPVLARRILEQRARIGRFESVEELREVRGVGPRLLERLRPRVRAGSGR